MIKYFDINDNGHSIRCKLFCNDQRSIDDVILCGHGFAGHKDNKSTERFAETVLSKNKPMIPITKRIANIIVVLFKDLFKLFPLLLLACSPVLFICSRII